MNKILCTASLLVLAALGYLLWQWQERVTDSPVLTITAPRAVANEIPVFAQFTVIQSFILHQPAEVVRIEIPVRVSSEADDVIKFDLRQEDHLIERWRIKISNLKGKNVATLPFALPTHLKGRYEMHMSASDIGHDRKDEAVAVYIETNDDSYPDGNYRVVENNKKGDVSMVVLQRTSNYKWLTHQFTADRVSCVQSAGLAFIMVMLLLSLPYVIGRVINRG